MIERDELSPYHEAAPSPEVLAGELVARIDLGLHELGVPPRDKRVWGWCNFVPDAVSYCATQDGQEKDYKVRAAIYQAIDLHLVAAGKRTVRQSWPVGWDPRAPHTPEAKLDFHTRISAYYADPDVGHIHRMTFSHGFNVVDINDEPFLVDLSFSQFVGADGMLVQGGDQKSSGVSVDHPLAQRLLREGFAPLDDENLRSYMRFLCTNEPPYLGDVTVDLLRRADPLQFVMDDNELMGRIPPAYQGTEV